MLVIAFCSEYDIAKARCFNWRRAICLAAFEPISGASKHDRRHEKSDHYNVREDGTQKTRHSKVSVSMSQPGEPPAGALISVSHFKSSR
jgi:hypothetical protein